MADKRVLCLGDAAVDIVVPYGQALRSGYELPVELICGGSTGNLTYGLTRLGIDNDYVAKVGDDELGEFFLRQMPLHGVPVDKLVIDREFKTFRLVAVIGADGNRTIFRYGDARISASKKLAVEDLDLDTVDRCDILAVSGTALGSPPLQDTLLWAMRRCRARGAKVVFDINLRWDQPALPPEFIDTAMAYVENSDYILGSAGDEFCRIFEQGDMVIIGRTLAARGKVAVGRDGPGSVQVFAPGQAFAVPAIPTRVVDTIGAGDHFNSGFIAGLATGQPLLTCVRWGNAAASFSLRAAGGKNGATMRELQALVAAHYGG